MKDQLPMPSRFEVASLRVRAMAFLKGWGSAGPDGAHRTWNLTELEAKAAEVVDRALGGSPLHCHFCDKGNDEVKKLIAGPTSMICDECVALSAEIIARETETSK